MSLLYFNIYKPLEGSIFNMKNFVERMEDLMIENQNADNRQIFHYYNKLFDEYCKVNLMPVKFTGNNPIESVV